MDVRGRILAPKLKRIGTTRSWRSDMKVTASILAAAALAAVAMPSLAGAQQTIPLVGGARQIHIQTSHEPKAFTGATFTRVARISGIQIPAGWTGMFVATFNAESTCSEDLCLVKIVCDGVQIPDSDPFYFNFAPLTGEPARRSFSVSRRSRLVGGGAHSCEVRTAVEAGSGSHVLDDWLFAVEFWRRS
jgi:hypothetical protein